jgi:hypothetical protein
MFLRLSSAVLPATSLARARISRAGRRSGRTSGCSISEDRAAFALPRRGRRFRTVARMRMMGVDWVEYHRQTVLDRQDDHPGAALTYYARRGETPLSWGGGGAARLGLDGHVSPEQYEDIFGPGGARHPVTGERLASTKRPGLVGAGNTIGRRCGPESVGGGRCRGATKWAEQAVRRSRCAAGQAAGWYSLTSPASIRRRRISSMGTGSGAARSTLLGEHWLMPRWGRWSL